MDTFVGLVVGDPAGVERVGDEGPQIETDEGRIARNAQQVTNVALRCTDQPLAVAGS